MDKARKVLNDIEHFMIDIFEKQKELDTAIYADSLPKSILKRKDYAGHIERYKELKNEALRIDTEKYDPDPADEELIELIVIFEEALAMYNLYCDRGIAVQDWLMRKAMKEKLKKSEYLEITRKQTSTAQNFAKIYNDLTVEYTDYLERLDSGD